MTTPEQEAALAMFEFGMSYLEFLKKHGHEDTLIIRLAYISSVIHVVKTDPHVDRRVQELVLRHLNVEHGLLVLQAANVIRSYFKY
jgi:selenocysteine-specific translation elongation factor